MYVLLQHVLVVTRQFESQADPLNANDLGATMQVLQAMPQGGVAFYNCGEHSGRSQPHKHLQVVPLPFDDAQAPRPPAGPVLRLQGKLQTLVKAHVPESVQTWVREVELGRHPAARDSIDAVPASTIQAFGDDVECARQAALRAGATPVVLTHATYFGDALREHDRPQMVAWRKFYPSLSGSGLLDLERRANLELRRIAARPGTVFVDVASRVPPGREHFADFVHFTDAGALIVAQALAASILEEGGGPEVR